MDYTTLEEIVREAEKPSRFEHSLGVVEVCTLLSRRFHLDVELARMSGIFHDYARYMDGQEMLAFCDKHGIQVEEVVGLEGLPVHSKLVGHAVDYPDAAHQDAAKVEDDEITHWGIASG